MAKERPRTNRKNFHHPGQRSYGFAIFFLFLKSLAEIEI
jgi:hypothetical protein